MITKKMHERYVEWFDADEMHGASKKWTSELNFVKDEQRFFEDLIKSYTLDLLDSGQFSKTKELVSELNKQQNEIVELLKYIQIHENNLEIMIDGIDEPKKENQYKKTHSQLFANVNSYLEEYKLIKTQLFKSIKEILKKQRQKKLLGE
jgi:hypothetical protein